MALPFQALSSYGQIEKELGKGGYSVVKMTSSHSAVKEMFTMNDEDVVEESYLREITSLLKVKSDYVIPLLDVILDSTSTSLILPLGQGSLDAMSKKIPDVKTILYQMCRGLADIHNSNLLHLDLKPQNLLLHHLDDPNVDTKVWWIDLGISEIRTS